jgi:hypothetical protein
MSGAAGGSRIDRENLKQTIRNYRDNVLKPLGLDGSYNITGVRNRRDKYSYGDIDIVLAFKEDTPQGGDIKKHRAQLKQEFAKFLSQLGEIPTMPHKGGKKYFIHGNIVSILYPIAGREDEYVQIDNIISIGEEEAELTYNMLDLPAEVQGLVMGIVKAASDELGDKELYKLFSKLGINNPEKPGEDQEYEFSLNTTELTLSIVPEYGKSSESKEIWRSTDINKAITILIALGIDIKKDNFDTIIAKIKKFKRRSLERIKGMFKTVVRPSDAEIGTEKGNKKLADKETVAALQEHDNQKVIAVFPGKFKPPHKDHVARIKAAAADADEVIVLVSPKTEPGGNPKSKKEQQKIQDRLQDEQSVTADQTLQIFKLLNLPSNVKVFRSDDSSLPVPAASPVVSAYEIFKANPDQQYIAVFGKEEDLRRFGEVPENVQVKNYDNAAGNLSATDVRIALKTGGDLTPYLPDGVDQQKYRDIIVGKSIEDKMLDTIDEVLASFFPKKVVKEGSSGTPIAASSAIPSADRAELNKLYDDLKQYVPNERFKIDFQQDRIVITNKVENPISFDYTPFQGTLTEMQGDSFDYTPYLASILGYMLDKRMNILPLPDIKIKKDPEQANDFFGKTAYYRPDSMEVMLYTLGRHPKDVCRSFTHEMIHHIQNLEGRIGGGRISTSNVNEDEYLKEIEKEAYLLGNITFREWTDKQSKNGDSKKKVMAEGKYDKLSNMVSSDVFRAWKEAIDSGEDGVQFKKTYQALGGEFDVEATLELTFETGKMDVGEKTGAGTDKLGDFIRIDIDVDEELLPEFWEEISMTVKDIVRHEIEHLTHNIGGPTSNPNKGMTDDQEQRDRIKARKSRRNQYFHLEKEIDANLQGLLFRAKKERKPFADVVNTYLDSQELGPRQRSKILKMWRDRMPALGIRQSL